MPLSPPPRDGFGVVVPHDHCEILSGDDIIRRISEQQTVVGADGVRKISSMAYKASDGPNGGMSIDIKKSIEESGLDVADFVTTPRWTASVLLKVRTARDLNLLVGFEPIPGNDHHGEVWGNFTKAASRRLQKSASWLVELPDTKLC